ncbi:MAG: chaperonin GroEL [Anaerolineae bacterium]|nr:chaperonin GroEL [Anaerolineae bacterium]
MKRPRPEEEKRWQAPRVVFQPKVQQGMQAGINQIVDVIRPTLGPRPRIVAMEKTAGGTFAPEMLDDGGTIARRIVQLPGRNEDVGAMYIRHVLWKLHEKVGDGTATAAVIFKEVYNQGLRYLASGGNAMRLRKYLEEGMKVIFGELDGMTSPLEGKEALARMAESICYDPPLAKMIGEIFDIIGIYGRIEVRSNRTNALEREYIEGMYWQGGVLSRTMYTDQTRLRAELEDVAVLVTDLAIEDPRDLTKLLTVVAKAKIKALLLVAKEVSQPCIGLLTRPEITEKVKIVAVKTPGVLLQVQEQALNDLAILTGARPVLGAAGSTLRSVEFENLGRARNVWADKNYFGIVGGQGDPRAIREHIAALRTAHEREEDSEKRGKLEYRIGKLISGSAILKVGGFTQSEAKTRKELAERTATAIRAAMREGILPGGGVALLACRPALQQRLEEGTDLDERMAYRILLRAVEAPFRTLVENAGFEPSVLLGEIDRAGAGYGFDAVAGQVVGMAEAGVLDATVVQKAAVRSGVGGAALALTTDVIIHRAAAPTALYT